LQQEKSFKYDLSSEGEEIKYFKYDEYIHMGSNCSNTLKRNEKWEIVILRESEQKDTIKTLKFFLFSTLTRGKRHSFKLQYKRLSAIIE